MDDLIRAALTALAGVNPRDHRDATFYANDVTIGELKRQQMERLPPDMRGQVLDLPPQLYPHTLLGIRIRQDDNLPDGVIMAEVENAQERALRRIAADGHTVNVVKVELPSPPPPPTLRVLVRHWVRRLCRGR